MRSKASRPERTIARSTRRRSNRSSSTRRRLGSLRPPKTARRTRVASATQDTSAGTNGGSGAATFGVENPATGELITTVPLLGAEQVAELAARARKAQPEWAALGFDGRARVMRRAQQWMLDNPDRIIDGV